MASIRKSVFASCRGTSSGFAWPERGAPIEEAPSVRAVEDLLEADKKQV
jgi:hypothetical protein